MIAKERTKAEIEVKLSGLGDFVKIEYLENCLKLDLPFEVRRFVLEKLAEINESKNMFSEAARRISAAADITTTYQDKMRMFLKQAELLVKAGQYQQADETFGKALACGNNQEKIEAKTKFKEIYKKQAEMYEKGEKRINAMKAYEKLLSLTENKTEQIAIKEKLLKLYEQLGKMQNYFAMKQQLG